MRPTIIIREDGPASSSLSAVHVRDIPHLRRLLLQAVVAIEAEGEKEHQVPTAKLHLLRGFLANAGAADRETARRLLLMTLLMMEDEDEEKRLVVPHPLLPALPPKR